MLKRQHFICPICARVPMTGIFVTDHLHAPRWKAMKPENRKLWVRGLTCHWCNRFHLQKGMTPEIAARVAKYLRAFERRRPK